MNKGEKVQLSDYNNFPADLPVVIEDEQFLYPFMISPIFLSDQENINAINKALEDNSLVLVASTKLGREGERGFENIYNVGVIGSIMRKVMLPDGRVKILFQGIAKGKIIKKVSNNPLVATVAIIEPTTIDDIKRDAIFSVLMEKLKVLSSINPYIPPDFLRTIEENSDIDRVADLISSTIRLKKEQAYKLFAEHDIEKRLMRLIDYLVEEIEANKLQREIKNKAHSRIDKVNKEYFLKEQLRQIQKELGTDTQRDEEIEEYRKKLELKKAHMGEDAYKEIKKQIERLSRMHPDSGDANIIQGYLDWVLEIPYGVYSKEKLDIVKVREQLDKDHFSLEKPKERIEEYFAVKELLELRGAKNQENKGAIICFVGPPGVGKTSLANSIATALKRHLIRIALGGLEDVNELRGHRRTYIGAMPGRIVQGLI